MKKRSRILAAVLALSVSLSMIPPGAKAADIPQGADPGDYRLNGKISSEFYDTPLSIREKARINTSRYQHDKKFKSGYEIQTGIDVSYHQGDINWKKVKAAGVQFAIIRAGYRSYDKKGNLYKDVQVDNYIPQAIKAGIPVGAYIFSQAITEKEAIEEADYLISIVKKYKLQLPIVLDYEYVTPTLGRLAEAKAKGKLNRAKMTKICNAFCDRVRSKGYTPMVYANKSMLENDMYAPGIDDKNKIWLAQYNTKVSYTRDYEYWQYSPTGTVSGINDKYVDMDFRYVKKEEVKEEVPEDLKIKSTSLDSITIQWDPIEHAAGYQIYKKNEEGKFSRIETIEDATVTSYKDTGLGKGEAGTYKVRAVLEEGMEDTYSSFTSKATGVTKIDGTELLAKGSAFDKIRLSWKRVADATGYKLQRYDSAKRSYVTIKTITSPKTLSYVDEHRNASTDYAYRIRAYKTVNSVNGYSAYAKAKARTKGAVKGRVTTSDVNCRKGPGTFYGTWGTLPKGRALSVIGTANDWYKVKATVNGTKRTGYVSKEYVKTGASAQIGYTSLKAKGIAKGKIRLTWNSVANGNGYEIVRYSPKRHAYIKIKTITNPRTVSFTNTNLKKQTKYKYKIRAYQKNGSRKIYGFYSNPTSGKTK
ncbi:MAG: GH25 family lysozyme [Lachnospiraceae bacterium]|nr:GH25 family lysozyme [Lachnospiraceae bacterium]